MFDEGEDLPLILKDLRHFSTELARFASDPSETDRSSTTSSLAIPDFFKIGLVRENDVGDGVIGKTRTAELCEFDFSGKGFLGARFNGPYSQVVSDSFNLLVPISFALMPSMLLEMLQCLPI